jgi:hypothetical protein
VLQEASLAPAAAFPNVARPDHSYPKTQPSCTAALTAMHAKSW